MVTKKSRMLIKAVPMKGGYVLKAENGAYPEEKYVHSSRAEAYKAAASLYPVNSVWKGRKVSGGFSISI